MRIPLDAEELLPTLKDVRFGTLLRAARGSKGKSQKCRIMDHGVLTFPAYFTS